MGVFGYLWYLSERVFRDSLLFPFALSGLGVAIIVLGIQYQLKHEWVEQAILARIPPGLRRLLPRERVLAHGRVALSNEGMHAAAQKQGGG